MWPRLHPSFDDDIDDETHALDSVYLIKQGPDHDAQIEYIFKTVGKIEVEVGKLTSIKDIMTSIKDNLVALSDVISRKLDSIKMCPTSSGSESPRQQRKRALTPTPTSTRKLPTRTRAPPQLFVAEPATGRI